MPTLDRDYSHVPNFTQYMALAVNLVGDAKPVPLTVLDMPAGNGLVSQALRERGHTVTSADINSERADYVYVDMESALPFEAASFDVVVCLEGIEHVVEPHALVREFRRVLRPSGRVVLSMPNVQSLYSRLVFLFTGTFYQFDPAFSRHPRGRTIDRGHISPVSLSQLHYLFAEEGLSLRETTGDKIKKKVLLPFYALLAIGVWIATQFRLAKIPVASEPQDPGVRDLRGLYRHLIRPRVMLSRSLVMEWCLTDSK